MQEADLSDPHLSRLIRRMGLPAMAGLSLNAGHQAVDAIFVGRLGSEPLAALVLLAPLAGLVVAAGIGLGAGTASSIARALGKGRVAEARQISGVAFVAAAVVALIAVATLIGFREQVLNLLDAPAAVRAAALPYLVPLAFTVGLSIIQILCDFTAIGRGNSRFSLQTLALCFGLNIALDPLFIFGFGLGLQGAAWATLTAQVVTLAVWYRHFRHPSRRPSLGNARLLRPILGIGLPEAGAVAITTLGLLAMISLAGRIGGTEMLVAFGISLRLLFLVMLPLEGFAIGVQPILAHAYGANDPARVARALNRLVVLGLAVTGLLMVAFLLLPLPLARLFTADPDVAQDTARNLRWLAPALPAIALRLSAQILLQATYRPRAAALLGLAPMGWLLLPVIALTIPTLGAAGLALSLTVSTCLAALLAAFLMRRSLTHPVLIGATA